MHYNEDELLARELGKVGTHGGERGSKISGVPEFAGSLGGSFGARFAAKYLPTERYQIETRLNAEPRMILAKVLSFLASNGEVANEEDAGISPYPKISGVVGSGFLKMNPTVIHAEIIAIEESVCTVLVTGAAKEGLIKQRTAERAVKRLIESISSVA